MWLFIIADAATFGAILFGYGYLRVGSPNWTRPFEFMPTIVNGMVMTLHAADQQPDHAGGGRGGAGGPAGGQRPWLWATAALGALFAVLHLREWFSMFAEGWSPSTNPIGGSPLFGGTFFGITGLHLLHVDLRRRGPRVVAIGYRRGRLTAGHVETTGLYWHFVDLVWMFVFPLVYLMNAAR